MFAGKGTNPFFTKLREVVGNINQDVEEVVKKASCSKYELPPNSALLKLIEIKDSTGAIKDHSRTLSRELKEKDARYFQYHEHVEELVKEMEEKMSIIEDYLSGFGYQKFSAPKIVEQEPQACPEDAVSALNTPLRGIMKSQNGTTGKENVACSMKKTPMLSDYGLSSKYSGCSSEQIFADGSPILSVRKQLRFRTPLSSIQDVENSCGEKYSGDESDNDTFEITEEFRKCSLTGGMVGGSCLRSVKQRTFEAKTVTPETPEFCHRMPNSSQRQTTQVDDDTPKEPELLSCKKTNFIKKCKLKDNCPGASCPTPCNDRDSRSSTPEPPVLATSSFDWVGKSNCATPRTVCISRDSTTPELPTLTCSLEDWLR